MEAQLNQIRNKLINTLMIGFISFAVPTLVLSLIRYFQIGWSWLFLFHSILVVISFIVFLNRFKLSLQFKTHFLSIAFILIAFAGTIRFGISSSHFYCLISIIISTIIFGKRTGYIYLLVSALGLIISITLYQYAKIYTLTDFNVYNNNITTKFNLLNANVFLMVIIIYFLGNFYNFFIQNIKDLILKTQAQELTQHELQKSEERYRFLIENATFPVIVAKFNGEILFVNNCAETFLGIENNSLNQNITTDFWVYKNERNKFITELKQNSNVDNTEIQLRTNVNKIKTVLLSSKVIEYENQPAIFTIFNDISERKQIEETLKKSEEKFSKAFNACPVSITISSIDNGKYVDVNDSFITISGFTKEEVLGHTSTELNLWVENVHRDSFYNNLMQSGYLRDYPSQFRMKNSNIRDFILASEIIELNGEKHILNYSIDVTERKRTEAEIREKDLRIRASFDLCFEFIGLLSLDGTLIEVNQTAMNFADIKLNDVLGKPFWETPWWNHSKEEQQKLKEAIAKSAQGETITYEATHRASDGELHYIDFSLKPLKNEKNEVKYLIPEGRDITNIKHANDEIIKREHFLQTLINTIPDLIWLKNSDGVYLQCNKRFEDFFGAKEKDIVGKTDYNFVDQELANFFREKDIIAINAGKPSKNEENVQFSDGHFEFLETIKMPISENNGKLVGILGIGRDITDRKKLEEELKVSEEKYRFIVENSPIGIFQRKIDKNGDYNYFNPAIVTDFECTSGEEFLRDYGDVKNRYAIPEKLIEFNKLLLKNNIVENFEVKTILKNGKTKWFSIYAKLDNTKMFINGFDIDITERKKIELKLAESQTRLSAIFESTSDFVWSVDAETFQIVTFNTAIKNYFKNRHNVTMQVGSYIEDLLPKEVGIIWYNYYKKAIKVGSFYDIYEVIDRKVILHLSFYPLKLNDKIIGISVFGKDITEIKNSEKALKKSEEHLQTLLHSITDYMYSVKIENGQIIETRHGEGCETITGYTINDFAKDKSLWFNIVLDVDKDVIFKHIYTIINEKKAVPIEHRIIHKNGNIRWIRNTPVLRLNTQGEVIGYDGLISDITEAKILEREILNSVIKTEEKERLHFSQELHDGIGPLLSAIKMYVQWLETPDEEMNQVEILKDIEKLVEESSSTIREISFKLSPHILQNYGLYEAVKAYSEKIKESSKIDILLTNYDVCRFNENAETIIYRVLCECINNTLKHAKATKITIKMNCDNSNFYIEYSDNGKGFNVSEVLQNHKGIGLMNMQSRIISINGIIEIKSEIGKGSTMKFQFDKQYL